MRAIILILLGLSLSVAGCRGGEAPPEGTSSESASGALGGNVDGPRARTLVGEGAFLLDVRTGAEFAAGHIDGATNIPVQELEARMAEVPNEVPVVVYCQSGGRAAAAARMLRGAGHTTYDLGRMSAW